MRAPDRLIASVPKNDREQFCILVSTGAGRCGVYVRVLERSGRLHFVDTKRSMRIRPHALRGVIRALRAAEAALVAEGVLPAEGVGQ